METLRSFIQFTDQHSGFVLAILTALYVVATLVLVWLTYRQFYFAVEMERQRSLPLVTLDVHKERHFVSVKVNNHGKTEARNIKIEAQPNIRFLFSEPRPSSQLEEGSKPIPFVQNGIAILPAGREVKALVGSWRKFCDAYPSMKFSGQLTYQSADGRRFSTPINIDLSCEEGLANVQRYETHDIAKILKEIREDLNHIATGYRKPLVRVITEAEFQKQEEAEFRELTAENSAPDP